MKENLILEMFPNINRSNKSKYEKKRLSDERYFSKKKGRNSLFQGSYIKAGDRKEAYFRNKSIPAGAKLANLFLQEYWLSKKEEWVISNRKLMGILNCSLSTITKILKELEDLELIKRETESFNADLGYRKRKIKINIFGYIKYLDTLDFSAENFARKERKYIKNRIVHFSLTVLQRIKNISNISIDTFNEKFQKFIENQIEHTAFGRFIKHNHTKELEKNNFRFKT